MGDVKKEIVKMEYPHVQAAFINDIREEGTKDEACDWLQKTWNELCALRATLRQPDTRMEDAALVDAGIDPPQSPNPEHVEGDVSVGEMEVVTRTLNLVEELCDAVDAEAEDVGGHRGSLTILREIGPIIMDAKSALSSAQSSIQRAERERDEALKIAKGLTRALVDLTPGGSEYFTRCQMLDDYFADVDQCTRVIRERFSSGHQAKIERVDERRRATAAEAQLEEARKVLEELVDTLTPAEHASGRDPAFGDHVRAIGAEIGFGALMSCASTEWRLWLEDNGYPVGSEFVSGPCRAVLQSDLRAARTFLASLREKQDAE